MTDPAAIAEPLRYPSEAAARNSYERRAYDDWYRAKDARFGRPFYYHNKYVSRLCCAGLHLKADNWHRVRVIVAVQNG